MITTRYAWMGQADAPSETAASSDLFPCSWKESRRCHLRPTAQTLHPPSRLPHWQWMTQHHPRAYLWGVRGTQMGRITPRVRGHPSLPNDDPESPPSHQHLSCSPVPNTCRPAGENQLRRAAPTDGATPQWSHTPGTMSPVTQHAGPAA